MQPKSKNDKRNGYFYPVPRIKQLWNPSRRICEQSNYIPHRSPRNANRYEWHDVYLTQLIDIYNIIQDIINERYSRNKIKWMTNDKIFHNLSLVIYHCSSKYIENESKKLNH